jgi:hypothetical protein
MTSDAATLTTANSSHTAIVTRGAGETRTQGSHRNLAQDCADGIGSPNGWLMVAR